VLQVQQLQDTIGQLQLELERAAAASAAAIGAKQASEKAVK